MKRKIILELYNIIAQSRTKGFTVQENLNWLDNFKLIKKAAEETRESLLQLLAQHGIQQQNGVVDTTKVDKEAFADYQQAEINYLDEVVEIELKHKFSDEKLMTVAEQNEYTTAQIELLFSHLKE